MIYNDDDRILANRFRDLYMTADSRGYFVCSDFLSLADQNILSECGYDATLTGGYDNAERKIAVFGETYGEVPPIQCIEISPVAPKFADKLTHRDFLGSLIGLGITRDVLGDILITDNKGYLFCLESISEFIINELTQVKHTTVVCRLVDAPPDICLALPDITNTVVSSERLDAIVAAVWKISRSESQQLIDSEVVYINSRLYTSHTKELKQGDIISVRGKGRFIYEGISKETKKGRLAVNVRIFK